MLCWFFLNQGDAGAVGYWDKMLHAGCDVPPPQAGTGGYEEHHWSPQIRMSFLHPISSAVSPGLWGKRGSQAGFGWAEGADPALGRGEEGAAPSTITTPLQGADNTLYPAVSWGW